MKTSKLTIKKKVIFKFSKMGNGIGKEPMTTVNDTIPTLTSVIPPTVVAVC